MCVLSLRHGGVRMLLNREETEVSYSVGYLFFFFFTVTFFVLFCGGRQDIHDRSWHSKTIWTRHTKRHCTGLSLLQSAGCHTSHGWKGQICQARAWPSHQPANTDMLDSGHVLTFLKEQKHAFLLCEQQADSFNTGMSSVSTAAFSFLPPLLPTLCFLG